MAGPPWAAAAAPALLLGALEDAINDADVEKVKHCCLEAPALLNHPLPQCGDGCTAVLLAVARAGNKASWGCWAWVGRDCHSALVLGEHCCMARGRTTGNAASGGNVGSRCNRVPAGLDAQGAAAG